MVLIAVDLGSAGAACLVEARRGQAPRLRDWFRWSEWRLPGLMACLEKWLDLYPKAQVGLEKIFAMPGRAKIANNQFGQSVALQKALVKLGVEPIEVRPQGADEAEMACRIFMLSSPGFREAINARGGEHLRDSLAIAMAIEGQLRAERFEKKTRLSADSKMKGEGNE